MMVQLKFYNLTETGAIQHNLWLHFAKIRNMESIVEQVISINNAVIT
jgi:hypothetical protein